MKTITVTDHTYRAIAELAILPFHSTATRMADGNWQVPVSEETWDRLQESRLPGESDDDTVMRVIRHYRHQKPN